MEKSNPRADREWLQDADVELAETSAETATTFALEPLLEPLDSPAWAQQTTRSWPVRVFLAILAISAALYTVTAVYPSLTTSTLAQSLQAVGIQHSKPQTIAPRYVFVDLGANRADSLEVFLGHDGAKWQQEFPRPEWATYADADIYLVEGNPVFNKALVEAKEKYQKQGINVQIFPSTVADVRDGTRIFYLDTVNEAVDYWGSSVVKTHPDAIASGSKGTELSAINISRWLLMNTLPQDFVVVKMDIEGSEAEILPHMVEMGVSAVVDCLLVEFHTQVTSEDDMRKAKAAVAQLQREGVRMPDYDSPARFLQRV